MTTANKFQNGTAAKIGAKCHKKAAEGNAIITGKVMKADPKKPELCVICDLPQGRSSHLTEEFNPLSAAPAEPLKAAATSAAADES